MDAAPRQRPSPLSITKVKVRAKDNAREGFFERPDLEAAAAAGFRVKETRLFEKRQDVSERDAMVVTDRLTRGMLGRHNIVS